MFSILIIEDELLIAEMLSEMLSELNYNVIGIANDYDAAINFLNQNTKPNLCLVDINLESSKTGFDLVKVIKEKYQIPFVFLTSYADKKTIQEAINYNPEAYIVKPFNPNDLYTTIEIAKQKIAIENKRDKTIVIKDGNNSIKIKLHDIIWLKSDNIYVEIKLMNKKYIIRQSLDSFLEEINVEFIIRTHRSYAINIKYLIAINGNDMLLENNDIIPLSRRHKDQVINKFKVLSC